MPIPLKQMVFHYIRGEHERFFQEKLSLDCVADGYFHVGDQLRALLLAQDDAYYPSAHEFQSTDLLWLARGTVVWFANDDRVRG